MRPKTAFIIVSQSQTLARGICEVVATLAPEVMVEPCGCHDEGLGTASQIVTEKVSMVMEKMAEQDAIVLMADFGAARLACQQVITDLGMRVLRLGRGPIVEGTAAGVVAAAQGADLAEILRAIGAAAQFFPEEEAKDILPPTPAPDPLAPRTVVYGGSEPLSARPAARLARIATGFHAQVSINGIDAGSVLALMGLKVQPGDELRIVAEGGESRKALDAVEAELSEPGDWPEEKASEIPALPVEQDSGASATEPAELIKRIGVGPLPVSLEE